jgi:hypothetical protein
VNVFFFSFLCFLNPASPKNFTKNTKLTSLNTQFPLDRGSFTYAMFTYALFFLLFRSFYEETGEPSEYFWQIDRKIQFGE